MVHTVLFDLDGTLTDSREGILNSVRFSLEQLGAPIPEESVLLRFIGPPLPESYRNWCGFSREKALRATELFRERYAPVGMYENAAAPGMADLCARLAGRGLTLAVASSKPEPMCVPICARFGFTPWMKAIVGSPPGENREKEGVIRDALDRLGIREADKPGVVMVGDRKYDVEGARRCGLRCVGVEFFGYAEPGELEQSGAAAVARTPEELEQILLRL